MRYYVNLNDNAVTQSLYDKGSQASGWVTKRGGAEPVQIQFHRDGVPELLPAGTAVLLGIKAYQLFDGPYLTSVTGFTAPSGASGYYTASLPTTTDPINTALGSPDATTANDVPTIPQTTSEIEWWPNGGTNPPVKSQTFSVRIDNTPNNGNEVAPSAGTVVPSAVQLQSAVAAVTAYQITATSGTATIPAGTRLAYPVNALTGDLLLVLPTAGSVPAGHTFTVCDPLGRRGSHAISLRAAPAGDALDGNEYADGDVIALSGSDALGTRYIIESDGIGGGSNWTSVPQGTAAALAPVTTPRIAYVEKTGNDATAIIGDRGKPYATAQAAYVAAALIATHASQVVLQLGGACSFHGLYPGIAFTISVQADLHPFISYRGVNHALTSLVINLAGPQGQDYDNDGNGNEIQPGDGGNGYSAVSIGGLPISASSLYLQCNASGGNGGNGPNYGGNGGSAGYINFALSDGAVASLSANGGSSGGGQGGNSGDVKCRGGAVEVFAAGGSGMINGNGATGVRLAQCNVMQIYAPNAEVTASGCDFSESSSGNWDSIADLGGNAFD